MFNTPSSNYANYSFVPGILNNTVVLAFEAFHRYG